MYKLGLARTILTGSIGLGIFLYPPALNHDSRAIYTNISPTNTSTFKNRLDRTGNEKEMSDLEKIAEKQISKLFLHFNIKDPNEANLNKRIREEPHFEDLIPSAV